MSPLFFFCCGGLVLLGVSVDLKVPTLFGRVMSSPWCLNSSQVEVLGRRRPQAAEKRKFPNRPVAPGWPFSTSEGRKGEQRTAADQLVSFFLSKKTKEWWGIVARNSRGRKYSTIVNWCCLAPPAFAYSK